MSNIELDKFQHGGQLRQRDLGRKGTIGQVLDGKKPQREREAPNRTKTGDDICFAYNSVNGCSEGLKTGVVPG